MRPLYPGRSPVATRAALTTLLCTLVLLGLLPTASPVQAVSAGWNGGVQVAANTPIYGPQIAYDRQGFSHVVFFAGETQDKWEVFYTNNRSGAWAPSRQLTDSRDATFNRRPDLAVTPDGLVHVIYEEEQGGGRRQVRYLVSADGGSNWSAIRNISNTPSSAAEPVITADASNGVHVAWLDTRWTGIPQTTYSVQVAGGVFSSPRKVGGNTFEQSVDMTTSGSGGNVQAHIVYQGRPRALNESSIYFDVYYTRGVGGAFTTPANLSADNEVWSLSPAITSDGGGNLFVAWDKQRGESDHDIVLIRSNNGGASWTPQQNLTNRDSFSGEPALAFGGSPDAPQMHLIWLEGSSRSIIFYLAYDPLLNAFTTEQEQATPQSVSQPSIAASPTTSQVSVAYRGSGNRAFVSSKGVSNTVSGKLLLNGGAAATNNPTLQATFQELSGDPIEYRVAVDREPNDGDAWVRKADTFAVSAARSEQCVRTVNAQLRNAVGRVSAVFGDSVIVDTAVQATTDIRGTPGTYVADSGYTPLNTVRVTVDGRQECTSLTSLFYGSPIPFVIENNSFQNDLPLEGANEGGRRVAVRVRDQLGNEATVSRTVTIDRTPPTLVTGTLSIAAPPEGLPTPLATLALDGLEASDNLFPGGFWGAIVANTTNPASADTDPSLPWQVAQIQATTQGLAIRNWNVLSGLVTQPGDRSLAGRDIYVKLRLIDGAGNPSVKVITARVTLAPTYQPVANRLPALVR